LKLNSSCQFDGPIDVIGTANIHFDEYVRVGSDVQFGTEQSGHISLGKHVRINRGSTIFSYDSIKIGDYSLIGEYVTIRDANHGTQTDEKIKLQDHQIKSISIGNDVWIGRGACILPGVTIGDGSVIGANSVVTRSIESNSIAVGMPAKVIRKR